LPAKRAVGLEVADMYRQVKELMTPLGEYAVVSDADTLYDALARLDQSQAHLAEGRHPHRAVLVADATGKIVGKTGQLGFLRALEPKYGSMGNLDILSKAGMDILFLQSMMDFHRLFREDLATLCRRAKSINVKDVMRPVREHIAEDAQLSEAIHRLVMWQSLSLLVTRGEDVVGLIRLSDVFQYVFTHLVHQC
jgi:CBS domain-containing protein